MRKELKVIIENVVEDLIRREDNMGLPIHRAWEVIQYDFLSIREEVEYELEDVYEEIGGEVHTMKEIKEYAMECFDDVLEKYETEIMKMRKDWKRDMEIIIKN